MNTVTEQINKWIAEHGSERNALNIALARLEALQIVNKQLSKQLSTERSILDHAPVWAELANCPPDTVIGIRYGQIIEWQDEIADAKLNALLYQAEIERLQAQIVILNENSSFYSYEGVEE